MLYGIYILNIWKFIMINIEVTDDELRYLIACGYALLLNVPEESLPTYCRFTKEQIIEIGLKFRTIADENNIDL